jgi:ATP-dependent phosphoenolpyruvate carboxykinase
MWSDKAAYDRQSSALTTQFEANFRQFDAPEEIRATGPTKK